MRRRAVTILLPTPEPEPAYDLYEEVREKAKSRSRGPLGPDELKRMYEVAERRGFDWCVAVLGRSFPGIERSSTVDGWTLIVADELRLDPPLPPHIVEARKRRQDAEELRVRQAKEQQEREQRRWDAAVAASGVEMTVRENTRHAGVGGRLRHAVPKVELISGRSRKHPADRGLCETPDRANPLQLSEPVNPPANCHRCLAYMEMVRALDAPAPPTHSERNTLQLVQSGVVFTFSVRGAITIRDTSQRSRAAWGHLGRKADVAVRKLEKKGWVAQEQEYGATQKGVRGHRWRLTEAGTAALEG